MLGFNGGLMGVRKVPTTGAAPGMWFQNEQSVAKRDALWPPFTVQSLSPLWWYDFSDTSKVTTSGDKVTQVTDQGSAGFNLTSSQVGPSYVTGINGRNCIDWGSSSHSNYLYAANFASVSVGEFYIVLDAAFSSTFPEYNGLITGYSNVSSGLWIVGSSGGSSLYTGEFNAAYLNGSASNSYSSAVLPTINSPCLLRVNRTSGTSLTSTLGLRIGQDRDNYPRGWYGLIGEIIVFSSPLNTSDRNALQSSLASKWGITLS
jgi:hypothetical protein